MARIVALALTGLHLAAIGQTSRPGAFGYEPGRGGAFGDGRIRCHEFAAISWTSTQKAVDWSEPIIWPGTSRVIGACLHSGVPSVAASGQQAEVASGGEGASPGRNGGELQTLPGRKIDDRCGRLRVRTVGDEHELADAARDLVPDPPEDGEPLLVGAGGL
jgi:hypothetical protein